LGIIALVAAVQLTIIYFGGTVFRCEPLTCRELLLAALFAFSVIPAGLLTRGGRRRK
jgi:hypothetical protein